MTKYYESEEMYLETLLLLMEKNNAVHAIDVATKLNYSRASVSRGMSLLASKNLIIVDKNGIITFTEEGLKKAKGIYERHCLITKLLISIGADEKLAEENACRIEHVITHELFEVLKAYVKNK